MNLPRFLILYTFAYHLLPFKYSDMRKKLLTAAFLAMQLSVQAADYNYLNVEKTDGTVISLSSSDLMITFADGYLVAGFEKIAALSELSKMYFSNTEGTTAINGISADDDFSIADADAVYDISGRQLSQNSQLRQGVYIVKKNGRTLKVQVR